MTRPIKTTSESLQRAVALVAQYPGITIDELQERLGLSMSHTKNLMSCASRNNLCRPVQKVAKKVYWYTPERAESEIKRIKDGRQEKRRLAERERFRKSRAVLAGHHDVDEYMLRELPDFPVRKHCGAFDPLPFAVHAVRSVFELAT